MYDLLLNKTILGISVLGWINRIIQVLFIRIGVYLMIFDKNRWFVSPYSYRRGYGLVLLFPVVPFTGWGGKGFPPRWFFEVPLIKPRERK